MLRTLLHHRGMSLAVVLGAATTTAVLVGALVVGDSVRGSLRDLTLERLGGIEHAAVAARFFPEDLADRLRKSVLGEGADVAPAIVLEGSVEAAGHGTRATGVGIQGFDARFLGFFPDAPVEAMSGESSGFYPPAWIDPGLAEELGVGTGDEMVIALRRWNAVPAGSLMGRKETEEVVDRLRATVAGVLPAEGLATFALRPHQAAARNVFLPLAELQSELRQKGRVNALLVGAGDDSRGDGARDADELASRLRQVLRAADLGLELEARQGYLNVESDELILRPEAVAAIERAATSQGARSTRLLTYLANRLRVGEREVPYSTVTALPLPPPEAIGALEPVASSVLPAVDDGGVLVDAWLAEELAAGPGDPLELTYFQVGSREELLETTTTLRIAGVVAMSGLGADPTLAQEVPGVSDAANMADWDPPFPVELARVRPVDEDYWHSHRGTPKAFLPLATGQRLWGTRWGDVTALRLVPGDGRDLPALEAAIARAVVAELPLAPFGLEPLPVKELGLAGAGGSSDFGQLFLGFSFFLLVSAALLSALLFALGVEGRAGEIGLLLALGYPQARVRRRLLGEGLALASAGAVLGLAGAALYAAAVMAGLRTWWRPAVGTSRLFLHLQPATLVAGGVASILVVLAAVAFTVRRVGRVPAATLLRRVVEPPAAKPGRLARRVAVVALGSAAVLVGVALFTGEVGPGLFFAVGPAALIGLLALFSLALRGAGRLGTVAPGRAALPRLALGNGGRNPGRSLLATTLVATATFLILTVASFQVDLTRGGDAGTGGFDLVAESDVPLVQDLTRPDAQLALGLPAETRRLLAGVRLLSFRLLPGDDASCLNLYQPSRPRLLGVPPGMSGFAFHQTAEPTAEPWSLLDRDLGPDVVPVVGDLNSTQWILKLGLGDELAIEDERGRPLRLRLVGTLETSVFQSELLLSEAALLRHFPSRGGWQVFLLGGPHAAALGERLEAELGHYGFDAVSAKEKLAAFHAVENTYLSTFLTLGGLGLLLGTVGLAVVLARNVLERRPELAAMQAFGFERSRLRAMIAWENALVLAAGLAIGTVGAILAVAPHLLDPAAAVPWASIVATLGGILAFGLAAGAAVAAVALRSPLLPALKADR